ncbi:putative membrane-bound metal-dependent hydrolase [Rubidibacter lacunae KORDI 51-2]|uniref:Putative membrane-bound metal-dependent hydrolase n=1 Tax=Rubidibacter lacunae KORDI 51-2 TaxID=582515 RepID=U5DI42_9CHRO|nr:metal-dependent hydrolase [Rubidibacter lacunae]ERN41341.1 putative membrane-bound metal-dependent hydrolase [Rubidibacter lacunae KORDI 51-2]
MMTATHMAFSVTFTSLALGTASPGVLGVAAIASLVPDIDTTRSLIGRVLFPIARLLERRFPHRSLTHSFLGTGIVTLVTCPTLAIIPAAYWHAWILGYFLGWAADMLTKSGVAAGYPSSARWIFPRNPRLRLQTGSGAEYCVLFLLTVVAIASIALNSGGGILASFNRVMGLPSGAVQEFAAEGNHYLMFAKLQGRSTVTQQPVEGLFEVVQVLTQSELLVRDRVGFYQVWRSQQSQIYVNRISLVRGQPIEEAIARLSWREQLGKVAIAELSRLPARTYLSGTVVVDTGELLLVDNPEQFPTITLQPGSGTYLARLRAATPAQVAAALGDYYLTGDVIARSVYVR